MPFNSLKKYNETLDVDHLCDKDRVSTLQKIFDRDFISRSNYYNGKKIISPPKEDQTSMDVLFLHLTRKTESPDSKKRIYDRDRAIRIHWIKHHFDKCHEAQYIEVFSVRDQGGIRTYFFNESENYVIILEPKGQDIYFLITAYYLKGGNIQKIKNKKKRKLDSIY